MDKDTCIVTIEPNLEHVETFTNSNYHPLFIQFSNQRNNEIPNMPSLNEQIEHELISTYDFSQKYPHDNREHLFENDKLNYVQTNKPCILCTISKNHYCSHNFAHNVQKCSPQFLYRKKPITNDGVSRKTLRYHSDTTSYHDLELISTEKNITNAHDLNDQIMNNASISDNFSTTDTLFAKGDENKNGNNKKDLSINNTFNNATCSHSLKINQPQCNFHTSNGDGPLTSVNAHSNLLDNIEQMPLSCDINNCTKSEEQQTLYALGSSVTALNYSHNLKRHVKTKSLINQNYTYDNQQQCSTYHHDVCIIDNDTCNNYSNPDLCDNATFVEICNTCGKNADFETCESDVNIHICKNVDNIIDTFENETDVNNCKNCAYLDVSSKTSIVGNNSTKEQRNIHVPIPPSNENNEQCNTEHQNISIAETSTHFQNADNEEVNDGNYDNTVDLHESKFSFINVCGLKSKLSCPEFYDFISSYDIIGMVETKINEIDIILNNDHVDTGIPGYVCFHKTRKKRNGTTSGGIAIMVKNSLKEMIQIIETDNDNILWCKINGFFSESNEDLLLGVAYISPEGSQYSNTQCFNDIERDYYTHFIDMKYSIVAGDFNSYISNKPDFYDNIDVDDDTLINVENNHEQSTTFDVKSALEQNALPQSRMTNCKHRVNNWGNRFLDLVKGINFFILNGRYGPSSGKCTTIHESIIDFAIASIDMMPIITNFNTMQFCPLLSDCHVPIEFNISNKHHHQIEQLTHTISNGQPSRLNNRGTNLDYDTHLPKDATLQGTEPNLVYKSKK